jgi:protoporphyrinogen oxidase
MCISRISEPKNRSEALAPPHETSLVAEVPCSDGDSLFLLSEESLKDRVVAEITRTGLIRSTDVADWRHHFLPYAYPTYSLNYRQALSEVLEGLQAISNLTTLGRNGRFFYSHMHDQLFMAKEFVSRFNAQSA